MKKILILTALTVSVVVLGYGISYAQEPLNEEEPRPVPIEDNNILPPPREEFDMKQRPVGLTPAEFNKHKKGPIHEHIKGPRPSKAEMEAKKAEFEKRLNLTEKQKKQIEANRKKDHEKVKPIFDQMRDKKHELRRLERDSSISQKDKAKKIDKLNSEIKLLNEKADKYRQENMKNFVKDDTIILSLLNGVTSEEVIAAKYGWDKVLLAFFIGHSAIREGRNITHDDVNIINFGEKNPNTVLSEKTLRVKRYFDSMGINYKIPSDMYYAQWLKFMLNVTCNQVSAILRMTFGDMQKNEVFKNFAREVMQECVEIAKAEGVQNTETLIPETINLIRGMIPEGKTSMLQDIEAGRKTEVDIFAGTIVKLGLKHNIPTPYNKILMEMIEIIHENQNIKNREIIAATK